MHKKLTLKISAILLFYVLIALPSLYSIEIGSKTSYYFKSNAVSTELKLSTLFPLKSMGKICANSTNFPAKFNIGPSFTLGASYSYWQKGYSKAHIYGPSFFVGLESKLYFNKKVCIQSQIGARGVYATFPNILWIGINSGVHYKASKNFAVGTNLDLLLWQNLFDIGLNLEISWRI